MVSGRSGQLTSEVFRLAAGGAKRSRSSRRPENVCRAGFRDCLPPAPSGVPVDLEQEAVFAPSLSEVVIACGRPLLLYEDNFFEKLGLAWLSSAPAIATSATFSLCAAPV
jgi:hypothetical protein